MTPLRQLFLTTLFLGLLLALWPVLRGPFVSAFRHGLRLAVAPLDAGAGKLTVVGPPVERRGARRGDTEARLRRPGSRIVRTALLDSRGLGFVPVALGLALVLASRTPIRARARALLVAAPLLVLYVMARSAVVVHHHLTEKQNWFALDRDGSGELPELEPSPLLDPLLVLGHRTLHPSPMCYLVPVVIWFFVVHWPGPAAVGGRGSEQ